MQILSNLSLYGTLGLNSVADANTDTDKFLVMDSSGIVKYRTGAELYNDIGAGGAAAYTSTLQHEVKAAVSLTKGQAVYVTSADGTNMIVSKASNASEATSSKTLGLIAQDLNINGKGYVITEGLLSGLNTMAAGTEGDPVWLGTDGNLIYGLGSKPYAPAHLVFIGIVTRRNANNGEIFVKVQNGFELDELHNVQITSTPSDNAVLAYETSTSLYKMKSISTLLGYTPTTNARTLTINGTSYDLSADRSWSVGTHTGNLTTGYVPKATGATTLTDSLIYDNGSAIGINTASPYESSAFKLDVNGGVIIKNTNGTTAQLILINSNPATGGNNGFVQLSAGGNTATAFGQWQTYYGMSVASGALRLQPAGGQVLIGTTTTSAFTTDINGTLRVSGQLTLGSTISNNTYVYTMPGASGTLALVSQIPSLSGYVQTSRTLTINGVSYDLSADRSWSITAGVSSVQAGSGISVSTSGGVVTVSNTGLLSGTAGSGISVSTSGGTLNISNTGLLSASAGSGISVSTSGGTLSISNTGLLSALAGSGISVSTSGGSLSISNTGILSILAGSGISVSTSGGTTTITNTITNNNQLTNGAGYITSSALTGYATQSYVNTAISNLVDSAPGTLDTLNELAAALGDDPNFATTIAASIGGKQAQLNGTGFVKASGTTITYDNSTYYLASNPSGYITGITSSMVTTALGYTPTQGSGTTNYIPRFTGSNTIGNSQIFDDGTNVGIGGASPGSRLSIYSGAGLSGRAFEAYYGSGANQPFNIGINRSSGNAWIGWNAYQSTGDAQVYQIGNTASRISAGSGFLFQVAASGTAGNAITWTDAASISTAGNLTTNSWARFYNINIGGAASGTYAAYSDAVIGNGNLHLVTTSGAVYINSAIALPTYINPVGGAVAIGSTSPGLFKLYVSGTVRAESGFSTYVNDGLFSANARPTTIEMPNGSLLLLGYYSGGNGIYYGRIGYSNGTEQISFGAAATNIFRVGIGTGDTEKFTVNSSGIISQGYVQAVAGYVASTDGTVNNELSHSGGQGLLGTTTNHGLLIRTNATTAITVNTNQTVAFSSSISTVGGSSSAQFVFGDYGIGMSRSSTYNGIWWNAGTDQNHVLWNDYFGGPTTRGAAGSGFDGIYWNTYRGIYIRGGTAGAYNCIVVTNSSSNLNDHTVSLYASNVLRLQTTTTGVNIIGDLINTGIVYATNGGVDGTFADAFVARYSSNNAEQNSIQTAVSSAAGGSGFRFQVSNGGGSSGRTTTVDFLRDKSIFYTAVNINSTATIAGNTYIQPNASSNNVGLFIQNNSTGGYGSSLGLGLYGYNTGAYYNPLRIEASYPGYGLVNFYVKSQSNSSEVSALQLDGSGSAAFSGSVTISTSTSPGLNIVKNASVDNRYLRLTNTQASAKAWDLINQTNAASNKFVIYNATDNLAALEILTNGGVNFSNTLYLPSSIAGRTAQIEFANSSSVNLLGMPNQTTSFYLTYGTGNIHFRNDNAGEILRLINNANVYVVNSLGIGTASPGQALTLGANKNIRLDWGGGTDTTFEMFYDTDFRQGITFQGNARKMTIHNYSGDTTDTTITLHNGNVGINTTVPVPHQGKGVVIRGVGGSRAIMELWDDTSGKSVFQNVTGDTYIGQLDKGTGQGRTYLLVNGNGSSADVAVTLNANGQAVFVNNVSAGTTINWYSGIGALSYGSGFITMETNSANAIQFKTNGSLAQTIDTSQNIAFTNNIGLNNAKGIYFATLADENWKIYRTNAPNFTRSLISGFSLNINAHYSNEGFAIGANGGNSYYEILGTGATGTSAQHFFRGTVGINTTSTSGTYGRLTVAGGIQIADDNNAKLEIGRYSAGAPNSYIKLGANSNSLRITNNIDSLDILQITNDGNVGILVTPPAWATFKALNIGGSSVSANGSNAIILSRNWYFDGGERYFESGTAQRLELVGNGFFFQTAGNNTSGAGAALSWTTQMSLSSSGNLSVTGSVGSASLSTGTINGGRTSVGVLNFTCGFSSYTTDGLFSASAVYSYLTTPSGSDRVRFGYNDYGGGQYYGAIGFQGNTNFSIGHRYSSNGDFFGIGTGYRGNGVVLDSSNRVLVAEKLSIGGWGTPDAALNIRGYGVADASTTYGVILDRGTKIAWTNTGNASTGEYIYSQADGPYSVTIHSGGYNALACPNTGHVYINYESGTCSIGSTSFSTSYKLYVTGQIYATSDITAYSDRRKKENIITIDNALNKVSSLRGVFYNRIDDDKKKRNVGVIAQEVLEVLPEAVSYAYDTDEYGVKYGNMAGLFIEAIKEQQKQIEELKSKLDAFTK